MNKTIKGATKSKMIWLSGALAALTPALEAFPEMKMFLAEYYGPALILLAMTVAILRYVTTKPLSEK